MAFMVLYMIGAPIFGRLAERHSRWFLVAIGVIAWSLASGASGLATTFFGLLLTRCLVGVGEAAYGPVAPTIISDLYHVKDRGRVLAWFYMAIPVGSALGYVLGGAVAGSSIGAHGAALLGIHAESWRWAFFLVVPPGLALGVVSLFMKEPGQSPSRRRRPRSGAGPLARLPRPRAHAVLDPLHDRDDGDDVRDRRHRVLDALLPVAEDRARRRRRPWCSERSRAWRACRRRCSEASRATASAAAFRGRTSWSRGSR